MAREFAKAFYKSDAWRSCRASYIKSVAGLCEECLARGLYTPGKVVHHKQHITPENINDPSITLSWTNLKLLCQNCHAKEHRSEAERYRFDENGNIIDLTE